jgi:hypothetical protein
LKNILQGCRDKTDKEKKNKKWVAEISVTHFYLKPTGIYFIPQKKETVQLAGSLLILPVLLPGLI